MEPDTGPAVSAIAKRKNVIVVCVVLVEIIAFPFLHGGSVQYLINI